MTYPVLIHLSDETYQQIASAAAAQNTTPAAWLSRTVEERLFPSQEPSGDQLAIARKRLRPWLGCVQSGDANASENERIERDLADAYADQPRE